MRNDERVPVLHFTNSTVRGGAEEHMLLLLRVLDRRQFRVYCACPPALAEQIHQDVPADVELVTLELGSPRNVNAAAKLAYFLRSRQIAILHSHMFTSSLFASPVGWFCRVPVIVETTHLKEAWRSGWKASFMLDRIVARCVDQFIAVSRANAEYLVNEKRYPADKVSVIENGCDLNRFQSHPCDSLGLRQRLGFGAYDPVLVVLARLEPQKGHRVLVDAMPRILQECPAAKAVFVGDGACRREVEAQIRRYGLDNSVRLPGYSPDVGEWLSLATLTVLPSFYEGLPGAPIESLAAGKPVVATAVDGTTEVVIHEQTGLAVPAGDAPALAEAVCRLLRDESLRKRLAACGHRWVFENFSMERMVRRTQELYWRLYCQAEGREAGLASAITALPEALPREELDEHSEIGQNP